MQLLSRIAALPHQNYVLSLLQTSFQSVVCRVSEKNVPKPHTPYPTVGGVGGDGGDFSETRDLVIYRCH